jgi:hypothetical protein
VGKSKIEKIMFSVPMTVSMLLFLAVASFFMAKAFYDAYHICPEKDGGHKFTKWSMPERFGLFNGKAVQYRQCELCSYTDERKFK